MESRTYQNIRLFNQLPAIENVRIGMHTLTERPFARSAGVFIVLWASAYAAYFAGGWITLLCHIASLTLACLAEWSDFRRTRGRPAPAAARLAVDALIAAISALSVFQFLRHFAAQSAPAGTWWPFIAPIIYTIFLCARSLVAGVRSRDEEMAALRYLGFVGLQGLERELADNLPYGLKRRLEIARAIAGKPVLLLLDEPAAGMNPVETANLMELIRKVRDAGLTVFLIEHHMKVVMGISDRIYVLDHGELIATGTPDEVRANPRVVEAYLGKEAE